MPLSSLLVVGLHLLLVVGVNCVEDCVSTNVLLLVLQLVLLILIQILLILQFVVDKSHLAVFLGDWVLLVIVGVEVASSFIVVFLLEHDLLLEKELNQKLHGSANQDYKQGEQDNGSQKLLPGLHFGQIFDVEGVVVQKEGETPNKTMDRNQTLHRYDCLSSDLLRDPASTQQKILKIKIHNSRI